MTTQVRQLLSALAAKIHASRAVLDSQHIANALYGLQRMTESPEVP